MRTRQSQPLAVSSDRMTMRHRATIWLLTLAAAAIVLACDLGLPSQTGQIGYTCDKTIGGCTADLELSVSHRNADGNYDLPSDLVGAWSDILVVPLSCDANCRATAGYIATYLALTDDTTGEYILAGYEITPAGNQYFERYNLFGLTGGTPLNSVTIDFGPTGIDSGYTGSAPYTSFAIAPTPEGGYEVGEGWQVTIIPPGRGMNPIIYVVDHAFFKPTAIHYIQDVFGRSGAAAPLSVFTNNYYYYNQSFRYYGIVHEDGIDHSSDPPYGQWLDQPGQSYNGGAYAVQCC